MSKAREMAEIISTPPDIYSTDAEVAATYLTQASASTIYKGSNFRNLIINGDMQVAQRSSSVASITAGGYYTADRWRVTASSIGTWTQSVENDAPTGSGFRKSLKMLCTTADASPAASDYLLVAQRLEGQNLQQISKGTASAKQLTASFWVKSNVTGIYIINLYDNDNGRAVSASYTISSSATWEKKTVTFPADTTGAFDNDAEASLWVVHYLASGTDRTSGTLNTSWNTYVAANDAVGQTNLAASTNNYWQITGVQLEVGSVATEFEFLPADVELAQCQRYLPAVYGLYGVGYALTPNLTRFPAYFVTEARIAPTGVSGDPNGFSIVNYGTPTAIAFRHSSKNMCTTDFTFSGIATGAAHYIQGEGKLLFTGCEL
jgi:hypothetical protein